MCLHDDNVYNGADTERRAGDTERRAGAYPYPSPVDIAPSSDDATIVPASDETLLAGVTLQNAPPLHTMCGKTLAAKVISVYDGDTVNIAIVQGGNVQHHKLRLYGIDTPELKPSLHIPTAERTDIIARAQAARDFLASLVLNKIVQIEFTREEKYGRLMGTIRTIDGMNVNDEMIQRGHAVAYFGGKKQA